jgi:hypothetical protein
MQELEDKYVDEVTQPKGWLPGKEVVQHAGISLDPDMDFFALPPPEIGEVRTAYSTLKQSKRPVSLGSRLLLCGLLSSLGIAALHFTSLGTPLYETGLALLCASAGWYFTRFRQNCSFVGNQGVARFYCEGSREKISKGELFLFESASELRTSQTRHYHNGVYTGTMYNFTWSDAEGRKRYKLNGTYRGENSPPKPKDPFHFAQAAEIAWGNFLLERAAGELESRGSIRFNLSGDDWVAVGPGFIDLHIKGQEARCTRDEIAGLTIGGGVFKIKRTDAKIGWFSKSGVFQFEYGKMANARLFVIALDKLLGYRFS